MQKIVLSEGDQHLVEAFLLGNDVAEREGTFGGEGVGWFEDVFLMELCHHLVTLSSAHQRRNNRLKVKSLRPITILPGPCLLYAHLWLNVLVG